MTQPSPGIEEGLLINGKYRLERELGAGGMGMLWVAHDLSLARRVAIKFPAKHHLHEQEARARFARESKFVGKLRSPRVVQVFEQGVAENGVPYIAMELLEGNDLGAHIAAHAPCSLAQTGEIVAQVCRALQHAHQLGLVHRDIKPQNIFLSTESDGQLFIKLLDFGIAKEIGSGATSLTRSGMSMGSLQYMSPEQLTDAKAVDARSDVWGLGVVIYELLTGRVPFEAASGHEFLCRVTAGLFTPASELRADLPKSIDAFLSRALAPDPARRFATIEELGRSFARLSAERATRPTDATEIASARSPAGALRSGFWGASPLALLLAGAAAVWAGHSNAQKAGTPITRAAAPGASSEPLMSVVAEPPIHGPAKDARASGSVVESAPVTVAAPAPEVIASAPLAGKSAKTPVAQALRPPSEEQRSKLLAAIQRADSAEVLAFRRLNPAGLSAGYTGKALTNLSVALGGYAQQGLYRVSQLHQRSIQSILVSADARKAQVRMTEVWESWLYRSATHTCGGHEPARPMEQTLSLMARADGWVISEVEFHNAKRPVLVACR